MSANAVVIVPLALGRPVYYLSARCQPLVVSLTARHAGNLEPENFVITMQIGGRFIKAVMYASYFVLVTAYRALARSRTGHVRQIILYVRL